MWHLLGYQHYHEGLFRNKTLLFGTTDELTGLHNRTYGEAMINNRLARDSFKKGILILIDIDQLREVNNICGYEKGDEVLLIFARKIRSWFGEDAEVCRIGGDEFGVFWETDLDDSETAKEIKRLLSEMHTTVCDGEYLADIGVSIGTAKAPANGMTFHELFVNADKALYRSKTTGKNKVSDYSGKMVFATRENEFYQVTPLDYQNILDSFREAAIFTITEEEHKILYFNRKAAEVAPDIMVGKICYEVWDHDCDTCPVKKMGDGEYVRCVRFDENFGEEVEVIANKILWYGKIPAVIVQLIPRIATTGRFVNFDEENAYELIPGASVAKLKGSEGFSGEISVGQFSERLYYLDEKTGITNKEQLILNTLLKMNHGVGIIAGYYDEHMSIRMISECALVALNYLNYEEFWNDTKGHLMNTVTTDDEKAYLTRKLKNSDSDIWSFPFIGKNGKAVSLRMANAIGAAPNGERMWYLSIRQFSEYLYDSLTGGYNKEGFVNALEKLRDRNVDLRQYAILYVDIKGFKALNELYGGDGGDNVLVHIYKRLATCKMEPLICARKGSDHFLLLVKKEALDLKELTSLMNVEWVYGNRKLFLACTCGVYLIDDPEMKINSMISYAELAMEQIQDEYANPYAIFDPSMKSKNLSRVEVLSEFDTGIKNREFQVYLQPIVDAKTGKAVFAEALIRWISDERGMISPAMFIPELEQSGYIVELDRYVCLAVRRYLYRRKNRNLPTIPVSVNLSKMDFFAEDKMDDLMDLLKREPFLCPNMHFEITETSNVTLIEKQAEFIETIRGLGGEVHLDDYGAGSASLDMIGTYNFSTLKIDMHFISQIVDNPKIYTLVEMITLMAHKLGLKVVAEGVETKEQLELLQKADCDYIQGYYFSKPLTQDEFDAYLER